MTIAEDLKRWRKAAGLPTQEAGADALNVPLRTYAAWENGEFVGGPRHEFMLRLAMGAVYRRVKPWPDCVRTRKA